MAIRTCPRCRARTQDLLCPCCGDLTIRQREPGSCSDPMVGKLIDRRYRIEAPLASGGMGTVYRAVQVATGQGVAVKLIRTDCSHNRLMVRRFRREALALSQLTHPNTVRLIDFGESLFGPLYVVMELLSGSTLATVIARERTLKEARAARIVADVCNSLAEAHDKGVVHRDLKPGNVMLLDVAGRADFVKVLDFGVAKLLHREDLSRLTDSGAVVGTADYMAPEQASGRRQLTPAVDVYAAGLLLYETLFGVRPFDGTSDFKVLMARFRKPIPDLPATAAVSGPLRSLMESMLGMRPEDRPTAAHCARELERIAAG